MTGEHHRRTVAVGGRGHRAFLCGPSAVISYDGRKPLSGDRASAPASELGEAFATSFGYAGGLSPRGNQVTHHVEVSTVQN